MSRALETVRDSLPANGWRGSWAEKGGADRRSRHPPANLMHEYIDPVLLAKIDDLELVAARSSRGFCTGCTEPVRRVLGRIRLASRVFAGR